MREGLRLFIERNPVREKVLTRLQLQKRSGLFPIFGDIFQANLRIRFMPIIAVIATIIVMIGGGTSLAAESSLPGDALYKVKVNVNEEVKAAFAVSDETKARLAASLAERRLQEAAKLTVEGRLTAEMQAEIESRFNAHVEKFEMRANRLAAKGKANTAVELSSNLEASLKAHGLVIASAGGGAKSEGRGEIQVGVINSLLTTIEAKLVRVQKTRVDAETNVSAGAKADVEAAAQGKLKAATNKIAEARGAIERTRGSVSTSTTAQAETRLRLAEEAVVEGKAQLEADTFAEAFISFDRAHRLAQEAHLLINGAEKFKVDLRDDNRKDGPCPMLMPAMPNWICADDSTAGPFCEDGRWAIKQCPSGKVGTSTESEAKTETRGEGKFWLNLGF